VRPEPSPTIPGTVVILSGSIGRGHDSVAEACRDALEAAGTSVHTVDCMAMLGSAGARVGTAMFRRMLSVPTVYDGFHFSHLRTGTWLPRAMAEASTRRLLPALEVELDAALERSGGNGPVLVLPVFPTGVAAVGRLRSSRPDVIAVAVCTDACAHRMWVCDGVRDYVVCSSLAAATVRRYDPAAVVTVVPPPVRPRFFSAPEMSSARSALGLPADEPCVLLMSGGWGLGPVEGAAVALADAGYQVLAVAGENQKLSHRLEHLARVRPQVRAFGMTDRVPELMAAADAVVTSPGQTCHEARVVGRWLIVLDVVPGHGRENTIHELEIGGALACSPDPASVVDAVGVMFRERPERVPWPVSGAKEWDKHFLGALFGALA